MNIAREMPVIFEGFDFSDPRIALFRFKDLEHPTTLDCDRFWQAACESIAEHSRQGRARDFKRALAQWLARYVPSMPASLKTIDRKFNRYTESGWAKDQRRKANKAKRAPKLSQADKDALVSCAVMRHGGELDRAWQELMVAEGLSPAVLERYSLPTRCRPRAPRAIRRQVQAEIRRLLPFHIGQRGARLNGAFIRRDWSNTWAGDWFSSDDCTLPVYYYVPADDWFKLIRGQWLPMVDVRAKRILDFVLIDARGYTAAAIRSLISRTGSRFGLPRNGWHFESGIWRRARLVGGATVCNEWDDCGETFADRLGLRIVHSLPGNARAKVVENILGLFQELLRGEPGYVGADEQNVKFERVQKAIREVESQRAHPAQFGFLSAEQWMDRLQELCAEYNSKPQQSEIFGGYHSPDEAWEMFQRRDVSGAVEGLTRLPENLRYLLAAHKQIVSVTRNGISLFGGKYRYLGAATGADAGEPVVAWFDPEHPETLAITDMDGENVRTVPISRAVDAFNGFELDPETAHASAAGVAAHNNYGRRRYSQLRANYMPPARQIIADVQSLEKGRAMIEQRQQLTQANRSRIVAEKAERRHTDDSVKLLREFLSEET